MPVVKKNNFDELIDNVYQTHCTLQQNAVKAVNYNLTIRNWLIGCYIVEFEQNGEDRARYGARLLAEVARKTKEKGIKGLDIRTLRACRTFYNTYPQIWRTLTAKLQHHEFEHVIPSSLKKLLIRGTLSPEFQQSEIEKITSFPLNETLVKYATSTDNQMFVSQYLIQLPEKAVLENFMKKILNQ